MQPLSIAITALTTLVGPSLAQSATPNDPVRPSLSMTTSTSPIERHDPQPVAEDPSMAWSTYLFSALLAMTTPTHAAPPRHWTVIVGGATPDTSIYANAFFP